MEVFVICLFFILHTCLCGRYDVPANRLNVRLNVSAINNHTSRDLSTCAYACMYVTDCLTFNYNMTSRWCELINITASQQSYDVTKTNGVIMVDITDYRQAVGGLCSDKPCTNEETFIPNTGSYICIPTKLLARSFTGMPTLTSPTSTSMTISTASQSTTLSLGSLSMISASSYAETLHSYSVSTHTTNNSIPPSVNERQTLSTETTNASPTFTYVSLTASITLDMQATTESTLGPSALVSSQGLTDSLTGYTLTDSTTTMTGISLSEDSLQDTMEASMSSNVNGIISSSVMPISTMSLDGSIEASMSSIETVIISSTDRNSVMVTGTMPSQALILESSVPYSVQSSMTGSSSETLSVSSDFTFGLTSTTTDTLLEPTPTMATSTSITGNSLSDDLLNDSMEASMSSNGNVIISSTDNTFVMVTGTTPPEALMSESSLPSSIQSSMTGISSETLSVSSDITFGLTSTTTDTLLEPTPTMATSLSMSDVGMSETFSGFTSSSSVEMSSTTANDVSSTDILTELM